MVSHNSFVVRSKLQHDSCGVRNAQDGRKVAIPLYNCSWRIVTPVWLDFYWRGRYEPFNSGSYYFRVGCVFSPVNFLSKQKRAMCRRMRKPSGLKVKRYVAHLIGLNEYFFFPWCKTDWHNWRDRAKWNSVKQYAQLLEKASIRAGIWLQVHYLKKRLLIFWNAGILRSLFMKV